MKTDSKSGSPLPADTGPKTAKTAPPTPPADEKRDHASPDEVVTTPPGSKSGSSVLTWDELVRQQNADDQVELSAGESPSASDQDILREVLSGEKPPSKVIPRTKSHPELKVDASVGAADVSGPATKESLRSAVPAPETVKTKPPEIAASMPSSAHFPRATPVEDDDDASFKISADSQSSDGSSILSSLGIELGSDARSGEMASGSRVDLLAHLRPKGGADAIPPARRDEFKARPRADDEAQFGDEYAADDDSSAVDLGSREIVDMPYPLGVDSSVGSVVEGSRRPGAPASSRPGDSGSVNLLDPSNEFNLERQPGMSSVVEALRSDSGHNLPPTVPMSPIRRDRAIAWVGGSAIGLVASGLVFALLYSTGLLRFGSDDAAKPITNVVKNTGAQSSQLADELASVSTAYSALQKKSAADADAAKNQVADARTKIEKANLQLQASKTEQEKLADEGRQLREQVEGLNNQIKQAQSDLAANTKRSDEMRTAAQKALKAAEDRLAQLTTSQPDKSPAIAKVDDEQLRARVAEAEAAKKALADFQHALNLKLADANLISGNVKPAELLAGVDKALQRRSVAPSGSYDSLQAERLFSQGLRAYRDREFGLAEQALSSAAKANDRDARIQYLLGLARYHLGRAGDAQSDFYAAAALERQHQPSPHEVDEILARLPSADRSVIGQYRP